VVDLVNEIAWALHTGRTTPGRKQSKDGWSYRDQATMVEYPKLKEK
jgi:hypothetical protein